MKGIAQFSKEYLDVFHKVLTSATSSWQDAPISFESAIEKGVDLFISTKEAEKKIIIIGNGGSAGIASHMSTDISKNGKIRAMCFSDASLLTCLSNDFSYEDAFTEALRIHANPGDLIILISSSGNSANILRAESYASEIKCPTITLSGFEPDNKLSQKGLLRFHLASKSYGLVEIGHLYLIHLILDAYLHCSGQANVFDKNKPFD